jgi:hypothetical protein
LPGDTNRAVTSTTTASNYNASAYPSWAGNPQFTIEGWVKGSDSSGNDRDTTVLRSFTNSFQRFSLIAGDHAVGGPTISVGWSTNTPSPSTSDSAKSVTLPYSVYDDQWHHVAATVIQTFVSGGSPPTALFTIRFYLDGVEFLEGSSPTHSPIATPTANQDWYPAYMTYESSPVAGFSVDEVAFYATALTSSQIAAHFNARTSTDESQLIWSDVSDYVMNMDIHRGRNSELDTFQTGMMSMTLDNTDARFDPSNTSSPHYPNVLPMRLVRVTATRSSVTYPMFYGYIERWPLSWEQHFSSVEITAVDGLSLLQASDVLANTSQGKAGAQIGQMLDAAGWSTSARDISVGQYTMAAQDGTSRTSALGAIQELATSELGLFYVDASGNAVFEDSLSRASIPTALAKFGDGSATTELDYDDLQPEFAVDRIVNDWIIKPSSGVALRASDDSSIILYFRRSSSRSTFLLNNADALSQASSLLARSKDPHLRFTAMTVTPLDSNTIWPVVLAADISTLLNVVKRPKNSASTLSRPVYIEAINWTIGAGLMDWRVTYQLSPALDTSVLFLDDPALGVLDSTAVALA